MELVRGAGAPFPGSPPGVGGDQDIGVIDLQESSGRSVAAGREKQDRVSPPEGREICDGAVDGGGRLDADEAARRTELVGRLADAAVEVAVADQLRGGLERGLVAVGGEVIGKQGASSFIRRHDVIILGIPNFCPPVEPRGHDHDEGTAMRS